MIGDEIGLTEELYVSMIGRYVAAIEVLTKRLTAKDQHIAGLEAQVAAATTNAKVKTPEEK